MYDQKQPSTNFPDHIREAEAMAQQMRNFSPSHRCDMMDHISRSMVEVAQREIHDLQDESQATREKIQAREILIEYVNKPKDHGIVSQTVSRG